MRRNDTETILSENREKKKEDVQIQAKSEIYYSLPVHLIIVVKLKTGSRSPPNKAKVSRLNA